MFAVFYLGFTKQDFLQRQEEFSVGAVQPGNVTNEHPYTKALIDFLSTHIFTSPKLYTLLLQTPVERTLEQLRAFPKFLCVQLHWGF